MGATTIEWTDHSVNPIRARSPSGKSGHHCVKVSAGCKNCYSSRFQPRLGLPVFQEQRRDPPELFLDAKTLKSVLTRRKPTKYFWCDMTDMFGEWVPFEWIAACFGVMAATPWHTHQVLTKRPERMREFFAWLDDRARAEHGEISFRHALAFGYRDATSDGSSEDEDNQFHFANDLILDAWRPERNEPPWPLPNVWLGTSVENRAALTRVDELRECPAAVRFLSCEPLLEDLGTLDLRGIHWCIPGGESGPGARLCAVEWTESILRQCEAAGVACFIKQLGAKPTVNPWRGRHWQFGGAIGREARFAATDPLRESTEPWHVILDHKKGGDWSEWPEHLRVREFPGVQR